MYTNYWCQEVHGSLGLYSRFIELDELRSLSSRLIMGNLKTIFARHGIPIQVCTNCDTQFTSQRIKQFAKDYGFGPTDSDHYSVHPQANCSAENKVSIAKRILLKKLSQPSKIFLPNSKIVIMITPVE